MNLKWKTFRHGVDLTGQTIREMLKSQEFQGKGFKFSKERKASGKVELQGERFEIVPLLSAAVRL